MIFLGLLGLKAIRGFACIYAEPVWDYGVGSMHYHLRYHLGFRYTFSCTLVVSIESFCLVVGRGSRPNTEVVYYSGFPKSYKS